MNRRSLSKKSYIIVKYWAVEDASPYNLAILRERLCRGRRPRRPQISFSTSYGGSVMNRRFFMNKSNSDALCKQNLNLILCGMPMTFLLNLCYNYCISC